MGWIFPLKSSNIVAFITHPGRTAPPRLSRAELRTFLESFRNMPLYEREQQPWQPRLISSRPDWIEQVQGAAGKAVEDVNSLTGDWWELLDSTAIDRALGDLRGLLGDFELFGLAVRKEPAPELTALVQEAAYASGGHAIYLVPDEISQSFDLLDPFPAIALLAEQPDKWPGILFWSRRGTAAFCSLDEARVVHARLFEVFRHPTAHLGATIDQILEDSKSRSSSKRLLHLSDLHFGTEAASANEAYLSAGLASLIPEVDRVIITGDLMQNPARRDALAFRNFRASLVRSGKDPVIIPGNHD